jgi:O-methyltransferase involved in polyketide biosynthesis
VSAGFNVAEPAVFVAEGLLGYLEEAAVHQLLNTVAGLASTGSVLLADVSGRTLPEGLFASHGWQAPGSSTAMRTRTTASGVLPTRRPSRRKLAAQLPDQRGPPPG